LNTWVSVSNIHVDAQIGARDDEKGKRQALEIDVVIRVMPPESDTLESAVDYNLLIQLARRLADGPHIELVETFAHRLALACLQLERVLEVEAYVRKPSAVSPATASVRVVLTRAASLPPSH
jgi:7,8-dihydroneopterin aldolase/epimerase/oxygenase